MRDDKQNRNMHKDSDWSRGRTNTNVKDIIFEATADAQTANLDIKDTFFDQMSFQYSVDIRWDLHCCRNEQLLILSFLHTQLRKQCRNL